MVRRIELGILALAAVAAGCGNSNANYIDGGTGGSGGSGGTGGTGGTPPPTATENYVDANNAWVEASCGCFSEFYPELTVGACEAGYDVFFPISDDFLLRPLSTEDVACIDAAVEASEGEAAVECLTTAVDAVVACFGDSEFTCDLEGIGGCLNALEEDRGDCPDLPESWAADVTACLTATPEETVPELAGLFSALCDCTECESNPGDDPDFQACAVAYLTDAVEDEETGEEAQAAVDCFYNLANRTNLCIDDAAVECSEDYMGCFGIFGAGVNEVCPEDAGALFGAMSEECSDPPA